MKPTPEMIDIDALSNEIRRVDGNHSLGAGALAEALMPFLSAALSVQPAAAVVGEPVAWMHPTANWSDVDRQKILNHCVKDGDLPVPLYAAPSAPDGWQPIETAPKDGTAIMAWHTVHSCPMAVVWKEPGHPFNGEVLNWYEKSYTTAWPEKCFSYWRTLPAPPALGGEKP